MTLEEARDAAIRAIVQTNCYRRGVPADGISYGDAEADLDAALESGAVVLVPALDAADKEKERLNAIIDQQVNTVRLYYRQWHEAWTKRRDADKENEQLREALTFYADQAGYRNDAVLSDDGERARLALRMSTFRWSDGRLEYLEPCGAIVSWRFYKAPEATEGH